MTLPTQAAVTRAVKAAIKGAHELGYRVSSYEVVFNAYPVDTHKHFC